MAENGNGNGLGGLPQWVRAIALVGVPSAIALYLVYNLTGFATTGLASLQRQMDAHAQVLIQHDANTLRNADALLRVMLRVCLNTAKNTDDRQRCVADR